MAKITQKYGGLKLLWHPQKLEALRDGVVTAPIGVRVKPTNKCNHRCFYCSYDPEVEDTNVLSRGFQRNDEIPKEKMLEILDDFRDMGVKAVTYSGGGEPLIYPHIVETLQRTNENGIDLSVITNGQALNGERAELLRNAKWVRISLDACDPQTLNRSRGLSRGAFSQLEKNIAEFAATKSPDCELGINFVIHHMNYHQVYEAAKYFKELGVNHIKFTPRWIDGKGKWLEYHEPLKEPVIEQIKRAQAELPSETFDIFDTYENDFKLTGVPERTYSRCPIMQTVPVIGADSVVYFCHDKTYLPEGALGSVKDRSFKDLWFSPEAAERFKSFDANKECKQHCTYDSRNILVNQVIEAYNKHHINFP